jgi:hypothetical protein
VNIKRLPIAFLAVGLVFKTLLVFLWRHGGSLGVLNLLIYYDPGARYLAEKVTHLLYDYGGITFAPGANACYEVVLIIGFGIESLLAGLLLRWLLGRLPGQGDEGPPSVQTKPSLEPSH